MNLAACCLLFAWGAVLAAGCGSPAAPPPPPEGKRDAAVPAPIQTADAGRDREAARGVGSWMADGPAPDGPPDAAPDAREAGRDAAPDTRPSGHCSAGHTCMANDRCERTCFDQLVSRCSCADGRYVCTGCMPVDGGALDASGPPACASGVGQGARCTTAGAVCQQRGDAAPKLCVCGEVGGSRLWICQ